MLDEEIRLVEAATAGQEAGHDEGTQRAINRVVQKAQSPFGDDQTADDQPVRAVADPMAEYIADKFPAPPVARDEDLLADAFPSPEIVRDDQLLTESFPAPESARDERKSDYL
jgi:hypothetical protein